MNIQNILIQNFSGDVIIAEGNTLSVLGGRSIINGSVLLADGVDDDLTITIVPGTYSSICIQNVTGDVAISLTRSNIESIVLNEIYGDISGKVHANSSVVENIHGESYLTID